MAKKPTTIQDPPATSSAGTGPLLLTKKNARTMTERWLCGKYDPVARKHVEYKEGKISRILPPFDFGIRPAPGKLARPDRVWVRVPAAFARTMESPKYLVIRPFEPVADYWRPSGCAACRAASYPALLKGDYAPSVLVTGRCRSLASCAGLSCWCAGRITPPCAGRARSLGQGGWDASAGTLRAPRQR